MSRKRYKVISIVLAIALLIPAGWLVATPGSDTATASEIVTVYHETFASGAGAASRSGDASLSAVTDKVFDGNADGAALYVSNRTNNWDAADFKFADIGLEDGKTYIATVTGYVDADADIPAGAQTYLQLVNSYAWLAGADFVAGAAFTLTGEFTVNTGSDVAMRVQSNDAGATVPFYIGEVTITGQAEAAETVPEIVTVYHETFASGAGAASQSGGASLSAVTDKVFDGNADGAALYVSNRTNNWDAADFKFEDIGLVDGNTYTATVTGYVDADADIPAGAQTYLQLVNSYAWLAGADFVAGAAFTLTGEFKVNTSTDVAMRVQSNDAGATVPFYIGEVTITGQAGAASAGEEEEDPRDPALKFETITFEDGTAGGFVGRAGTETLTVTNEANHTEGGTQSLKVENRSNTWHGPTLNVEKYVDKGHEYNISVWVKLISPDTSQIQLSTQVGTSSPSYNNLGSATISTNDGWVELKGTYRYTNISDEYLTIYVESANNSTASFYIDDISFEPTGAALVSVQKDLTPIKDVYQNDFLIGSAINSAELEGVRLELLKLHHNVATAENAMKPGSLQATKGEFTFAGADAVVDGAIAQGLKMFGHVLVWHQQSPDWMNITTDEAGNITYLSREEALDNMRTHIKTVMEHFGDRVIGWDVVNEAIIDNSTDPSNWRSALRQSAWYHAIGEDYVEQAFLAAKEVLDANPQWDIKLYYNDYNDDNQNKAEAIYQMVKEINAKYAETHPGELLIDGIGMQGHYALSTNPENVRLSLEKFISLGVEVSVSELDIRAGENSVLTEEEARAQGYLYAQLFDLYKKYSEHIARVTFWGLNDATSWRAAQNPLVFDKDLLAKPAYYGIIDPARFIEENPPVAKEVKETSASYGTPVIDGEIDAVWSKSPDIQVNQYQMAWQGATGVAKALWDEHNLYVLVQVSDAQLDKSSPNVWEQDSIEVFVDQNNGKSTFYQADDGQYRVNFDNETSFNPASIAAGFESATKVSGTNYTVEVKIPLTSITPAENVKLGFDTQINDGKDGARQSVAAWNDKSGMGYMDPSVFGVLTLVKSVDGVFADLSSFGWAKSSIEALAAQGLISGTSSNSFSPEAPIRKADFVALLTRALPAAAGELGGAAQSNPDSTITRQEMMELTAGALAAAGKLSDASVEALVQSGIVVGKTEGLAPNDTLTRAEAAVIIYRIVNK